MMFLLLLAVVVVVTQQKGKSNPLNYSLPMLIYWISLCESNSRGCLRTVYGQRYPDIPQQSHDFVLRIGILFLISG